MLLPVPIHAEDEISTKKRVLSRDRDPDVLHDSRAAHFGQGEGLVRTDTDEVVVPPAAVVTGDALASSVDDAGDVGERALTHAQMLPSPATASRFFNAEAQIVEDGRRAFD